MWNADAYIKDSILNAILKRCLKYGQLLLLRLYTDLWCGTCAADERTQRLSRSEG